MAGACGVGVGLRNVAIDDRTSRSGGQEEACPTREVGPSTHRLHDSKEEVPVDGIIGLPEVEEHERGGGGEVGLEGAVEAKGVREELEEGDVITHEATREESSLLWSDGGRKHRPEPSSQKFGEETVVGVEEGDGAIAGGVGIVPRLEEGTNRTSVEAVGEGAGGADCRENGSEERCQER